MTDFLNPNHDTSTPASSGGNRHVDLPKPLQEASDLLMSVAAEPSERMSDSTKARQRAALLAHASPSMSATPVSAPVQPPTPPSKPPASHKWRNFSFGFAGVLAAVVLVLVFVSPQGLFRLPGATPVGLALSIPAAHAGDAFLLTADQSDAGGVSQGSSFTVTSKVDVTPEDLKQSLQVFPALDVDVTKTSEGSYKITPKEDMKPGETYRFTISTEVDNGDGTKLRRTFSWALQAKNTFRLLSAIPADGTSYVPINTGIEFKFTRTGWGDAKDAFSITPNVPGRFENHGRSLAFIPEKPLAHGQRYEVILKKGFGSSEGDEGLPEDVKIRFETEVPTKPQATGPVEIGTPEFREVQPDKPWTMFGIYTGERATGIEIEAYQLTKDEARKLLEARLTKPDWASVERSRFTEFETATKTLAFKASISLASRDQIQMPAFPAGFYAVKMTPVSNTGGVSRWMFLQSTDLAAYLTADKDQLVAWVISPSTLRSRSNVRVRLSGQDVMTDADGVAKLKTPDVLTTTSTRKGDSYPFVLADFGDEASGLFAVVKRTYDGYWFDLGNRDAGVSNTWAYLYVDRPLYRQNDTVHVFGLAQDRGTRAGAGEVEVRLRKASYWFDYVTGEDKVYQSKTVRTDAAGRFETSLDWTGMSQGYYTVELRRGGVTISSRSVEIRQFVKPSYSVSLDLDREKQFNGEPISGTVRASFFEGTPVSKLKLKLQWPGGDGRVIETDDGGMARFSFDYQMPVCGGLSPTEYGCADRDYVTVSVVPEGGEEGEIVGQDYVVMYRSEAGVSLEATSASTTATLSVKTWKNDLTRDDDGRDTNWAGRAVDLTVYGRRWEKISSGYTYDYIEKKNIETFRYEPFYDAPVTLRVTTDASGRARTSYLMDDKKDYFVIAEARDDRGRVARTRSWIWPGASYGNSYGRSSSYGDYVDTYPTLDLTPKPAPYAPNGFAIDQEMTATYRIGERELDAAKTPGVFFLVGSRGIRETRVVPSGQATFRFQESWVPNADIHAVTWRDGRFEEVQATAYFRSADRELSIEAKPEKESYAPGETVRVNIRAVRKADQRAMPDTKLAWAAVDKALLAVSGDYISSPLYEVYNYVSDGLIFSDRSHDDGYNGFGGAEKGGGGGDGAAALAMQNPRKNFKDTAGFGLVTTDGSGNAVATFTAPDNITGWRFETVGMTPNLDAGSGRTVVNVTKPVFVDLVASTRLLTSDKPVLKLRAYGSGLKQGEDVTFAVKAPTLGIDQSVQGKAGVAAYFSIPTLVDGKHVVTVGIGTTHGGDALEREVTVESTRFLRDEYVSVEAAPGVGIPALGQSEADISLAPKNRAALAPLAYALAWSWSARSDAAFAKQVALRIMNDEFKHDDWWMPDPNTNKARLSSFQDESGGIRLLPYASADLELSSEVAATDPEDVDTKSLAGYFWSQLERKDAALDQQVYAASGLAALGEPVLPSIQAMADLPDLTWREQLALARGLHAAGDGERARGLLDAVLSKAETRDVVMQLKVSDKEDENMEATADAAALAATLGYREAELLSAFVESNWRKDAFPVLARARYLRTILPTRANRDITLGYTLGGEEKTILFKDGYVETIKLTADEASRFRVTKADGPITISFVKRESGRPASVPEIAIGRTYEGPLATLKEGDAITVRLQPEWKASAQDGCYVIRDHLPGGFQAVVGWYGTQAYGGSTNNYWYPFSIENGEVSFYICMHDLYKPNISYTARVVSRGTYTAEAPVMQHDQYPSVSAVGRDQVIEIK